MGVTAFTTSKGSVYNILHDTRTRRWKKIDNAGVQPESDFTVYLPYDDATLIGTIINFGAWIKLIGRDVVLIHNEEDQFCFPSYEEPAKDLCPLEIWGSTLCPDEIHIGNKIVDMW